MTRDGTSRRSFLGTLAIGSLSATLTDHLMRNAAAQSPDASILGATGVATSARPKGEWMPVSDRRLRVGIVGFGVCQFGAQFEFQNHPNVEVVAVSDLFPDRRNALMQACRCDKSYESLEELVKDPTIEAVFVATDAPSHARHCIDVLQHGKHVMTAVPAAFGSVEDAERVLETVEKTGLKYMMAETSCFQPDCYAMRQVYLAGGFGRVVYSEGEYFHTMYDGTPIASYKDWRLGLPPLWYPTHATAYYVSVTGRRFSAVSCGGFHGQIASFQPHANAYGNTFTDEIAFFQTTEGGSSRMAVSWSVHGYQGERGRIFGERGSMNEMSYQGTAANLPDLDRPPLPPQIQLGGHGGSHGPLTNEFVTAILENRQPMVNIYEALAMTVPGIVAHQSAMKDGETLRIPLYEAPKS